jgi:hypothetical protein
MVVANAPLRRARERRSYTRFFAKKVERWQSGAKTVYIWLPRLLVVMDTLFH